MDRFRHTAADQCQLTRTIHVDIRYMLWVMENVYPAPTLLEEMGVAPPQ